MISSESFENFLSSVSGLLSISIEDLKESPCDHSMSSNALWDSLSHLAIMSELEEVIGSELSIEQMQQLDDMKKIFDFLDEQ
tara:strand:- start:12713 stop:12958 length:246 start_codon:yes stop_codon:yes gene_type:complete